MVTKLAHMGYKSGTASFLIVLAGALLTACGGENGCEGVACPAPPGPSPTPTATPASESQTAVLPAPGALVKFPTFENAGGELVLPPYTAAGGTTATFTTALGPGHGPTPQERRRIAIPVMPAAVMSLEMTFSSNVAFATVPTTVFSPTPGASGGRYAMEVFDDNTGTLVFSALQGQAPAGIVAFSEFGADFTSRQIPLDAIAGHTYSLELVANPVLALPSPGPACDVPAPVPAPEIALASPVTGATNVPLGIGSVIVQGQPFDYYAPLTISIATATGTVVATPQAPSLEATPLPAGVASPIPGAPYYGIPLPTLAAATRYVVTASIPDWDSTPPVCVVDNKATLGTFTTGP